MDHRSLPDAPPIAGGALVVVRPFGRYQAGDVIEQTGAVREILRGEAAANVIAVHLPSTTPAFSEG